MTEQSSLVQDVGMPYAQIIGHDQEMAPAHVTEFDTKPTEIDGLLVVRTKHIDDERGTVREIYRESVIAGLGDHPLAHVRQVNLTYTRQGAIRGLHGESMSKLVGVASGEAYGAYVDARRDSESFGKIVTVSLAPGTQVLVPSGVCNGFQSVSEEGCLYLYCFDSEWAPSMPGVSINPLDPDLAIPWPIAIDREDPALLSVKDGAAPAFADLSKPPVTTTAEVG